MKFEENNAIKVPHYQNTFIYFLCLENEVVYVGQTQNGLFRPFSHKDKTFDTVMLINCEKENLDIVEDCFIQKYKPKYNKQSNYMVRWGVLRVRNKIREIKGFENLTLPKLKKVFALLNIKPEKDYFNGKETISFDDYTKTYNYYKTSGRIQQ